MHKSNICGLTYAELARLYTCFWGAKFELINVVEMFKVFPDAIVEPIISIYKNEKANNDDSFTVVSVPRRTALSSTFINNAVITEFTQAELKSHQDYIFNYRANNIENAIKEKIYSNASFLCELFHVTTGVKTYQTGKGIPRQTEETVKQKPFNSFDKID